MRRIALPLAFIGASACASRVATTAHPVASPTAAPTRPALRTEVHVFPPLRPSFWAEIDGDQRGVDAILGTLRVSSRPSGTQVADEFAPEPIIAAVHDGAQWVFADEGGRVFASDTFTGPLRPLGRVPRGAHANGWLRGRLVLVDDFGQGWSTDGTHDIAPIRALPAPLRDALFVTRERGVAIVVGGGAFRTEDGGATWTSIRGLGDIVDAFAQGDRYAVTLADGSARIVAADGSTSMPRAYEAGPRDLHGAGLESRIALAVLPHQPSLLPVLAPMLNAVRLASGRLVVATDDGVVSMTPTGGSPRSYSEMGTSCELHTWGGSAAVSCGGAERTLWRIAGDSGDATRVPVETPRPDMTFSTPADASPMQFSSDGERAIFLGECTQDQNSERDAAPRGAQQSACLLPSPSGPWRTIHLSRPLATIQRFDAREIRGSSDDLVAIDPSNGRARALTLAIPSDEPLVGEPERAFAPDGTAYGFAHGATSRWLSITPDGEPPVIRRVPEGVLTLAVRDRRHVLAAGRDVGAIWTTDDGGERWTRIEIPHEERTAHPPHWHGGDAPRIRCTADGCVFDDQIEVSNEGAIRVETIASPGYRPTLTHVVRVDDDSGPPLGVYRCEPSANTAPSDAALDARVVVHSSVHDDHEDVDVEWSGHDATGTYRSVSRASRLEVPAERVDRESLEYFVRASNRASTLLERCGDSHDRQRCDLALARHRGPLSLLHPTALGFGDRDLVSVESTAVLTDGSYAVQMRARPANFAGQWVDAAFVVRADGAVVARRRFVYPAADGTPTVALATWRGQAGLLFVHPGDRRTAWFYAATRDGDSVAAALPANDGTDVPLCAPGFTGAGATRSWLDVMPIIDVNAEIDARAELAIGDAGFCFRGIETPRWPARGAPARLRLAATANGGLEGEVTHDGVTQRLRCER